MIIDDLQQAALYAGLGTRIQRALAWLAETDFNTIPTGRYPLDGDHLFAMVSRYTTKTPDHAVWESHRRYIDVQYVATGEERMGWAPLSRAPAIQTEYSSERDVIFYESGEDTLKFTAGQFMILYPDDVHAPGLAVDLQTPSEVVKVVIKVAVAD